MDGWCKTHTGAAFDDDGQWAAGGQVHAALLQRMQMEVFFSQPAPKSTGRDLFNLQWLEQHLHGLHGITAQDVQTTLTELTAWACSTSLQQAAPDCKQLLVCGGGAFNSYLMQRMAQTLPHCAVSSTASHGLPPLQVEATAFAWLAQQTTERKPASLPSVTGARAARILGAIYPA
jgi:anhydro-N-acetylmuramic acid kinase